MQCPPGQCMLGYTHTLRSASCFNAFLLSTLPAMVQGTKLHLGFSYITTKQYIYSSISQKYYIEQNFGGY